MNDERPDGVPKLMGGAVDLHDVIKFVHRVAKPARSKYPTGRVAPTPTTRTRTRVCACVGSRTHSRVLIGFNVEACGNVADGANNVCEDESTDGHADTSHDTLAISRGPDVAITATWGGRRVRGPRYKDIFCDQGGAQ